MRKPELQCLKELTPRDAPQFERGLLVLGQESKVAKMTRKPAKCVLHGGIRVYFSGSLVQSRL
jgi:hypothetical protein